jgi:hypothetical protein
MARIARAAIVLAEQVQELKPRTTWTEVGEPDGLGVYRTVRFSKRTGGWLRLLLEQIRDPRIQSMEETGDGLLVTFIPGPKADYRDEFPLTDAETVLAAPSPSSD